MELINLIKTIIVLPIFLIDLFKSFRLLKNKKKLIIYHHGWGVGCSVHDAEFFRKQFDADECAVIFLTDGKHNKLIRYLYNDITIIFIRIYLEIFSIKKINLNKKHSMYLFNITKNIVDYLFNSLEIITIEKFIDNYKKEKNLSDIEFSIERSCSGNYNLIDKKNNYLPNYLTQKIEKKLTHYYGINISEVKKNIVCIYLRYKGTDLSHPSDYTRSTSPWKDYLKTIAYLKTQGFKIFLYGDYNYNEIKNDLINYDVLCFQRLKIGRDIFSIYSALNCKFFIGCAGGGVYFPSIKTNPPPILILNAMPFGIFVRNSTVSYKNARSIKNGEVVKSRELLNNYLFQYEVDGCLLECHNEDLIYDVVLEFINYNEHKTIHDDFDINFAGELDKYYKKYNVRISPEWVKSTSDLNNV